MKYRFLLHSLNHTILTVDISGIGFAESPIESRGQRISVSSLRFKNWSDAEEYFLSLGAKSDVLISARESLKKNSLAVLTVT